MNRSRLPISLYFLMLVLAALQWAHVYSQLPDVLASHFTGRGAPNNWEPKEGFFALIGFVVVMTAIPIFLVPRRVALMPPEKINLPNKEYWLAPERSEETWRYFGTQMAWFGCALLFLLLYAVSQAINANLPSIGYFNWQGMWFVLGGFVLFSIAWLVHFLRHFYKLPESDSSVSPH